MIFDLLLKETWKKPVLVTVISGEGAGSRAICENGTIVYKDEQFPPLSEQVTDLLRTKKRVVLNDRILFAVPMSRKPELVICGCGHVGCALARLGKMVGLHVTALDDRKSFVLRAESEGADRCLCGDFSELISSLDRSGKMLFAVMTRGHQYDKECLKAILTDSYLYCGLLSSRKRAGIMKKSLLEEGIAEEAVSEIYAPIGLKIGAESPEEIAVSVMAEMISVLHRDEEFEIDEQYVEALHAPKKYITAEITDRVGSAPRQSATRMLIYEDGTAYGTIGGGCMEAQVIRKAHALLGSGEHTALLKVDLRGNTDDAADAMACGGMVEVFLDDSLSRSQRGAQMAMASQPSGS